MRRRCSLGALVGVCSRLHYSPPPLDVKQNLHSLIRFLRREGLLQDKRGELPVSMGGTRECPQETQSARYSAQTKLPGGSKPKSKTKSADLFLRSYLGKHGEAWERDVIAAAEAEGFTQDQIRRARGRLGITLASRCVRKIGTQGWKWRLSEDGK